LLLERIYIVHQQETIDLDVVFNSIQEYCTDMLVKIEEILSCKNSNSMDFLECYALVMDVFGTIKEVQCTYHPSYYDYFDHSFLQKLWLARYEVINNAAKACFDEVLTTQWIALYMKESSSKGVEQSKKENESPMITLKRFK
jgi:hypothetical protein